MGRVNERLIKRKELILSRVIDIRCDRKKSIKNIV